MSEEEINPTTILQRPARKKVSRTSRKKKGSTMNNQNNAIFLQGKQIPAGNPCDDDIEQILCGPEAGCAGNEKTGTYRCVCPNDLKPPNDGPEKSCNRDDESEIPTIVETLGGNRTLMEVSITREEESAPRNVTNFQNIHQTNSVIHPNNMQDIYNKPSEVVNGTLVNSTSFHPHSGDKGGGGVDLAPRPSLPIPLLLLSIVASAIVVFVLVLSAACLLARFRRKRRLRATGRYGRGLESGKQCCPPFGDKNGSPPPSPFGAFGPFASTALQGDLSKCLRQYVTNPNYYSSSPDGPAWLRLVQDMEIPSESLTFAQEVGEGFFGKVHKAEYRRPDGTAINVAVKILKDGASPEAQSDFEREVEIMSSFNHENILQLMGVVIQDAATTPWMVFEFMELGDLAELLRKNNSWLGKPPILRTDEDCERFCRLEMADLIWLATQIASGMVYLSAQHFVHRDLACRNCLVGANLMVKISDFGMSRDIYTCDYYKIGGSRLLPVRWMAPESIMYGKFTLESDVWSYGVVLWEIFTYGKQPYYGHSNEDVIKLILQGVLLSPPDDCPPFISSIMAGCWRTEARERLRFPDVFNLLVANCPYRQIGSIHGGGGDPYQEELDADDYLLPNSSRAINLSTIR